MPDGRTRGVTSLLGNISPQRRRWLAAALSLLVLLVGFWSSYEHPGGRMDEGMVLVYPEMLLRGALPYRDFETFYGPANPTLLAGVFTVFGTNITVERTVGLLYRALILLGIFAIVQRWCTTAAIGCMFVTGCLLMGTGIIAYAWMGAMMCALWCLWILSRTPTWWRCFAGGLLAGLALLFRVDVGPAVILALLPFIYGYTWRERFTLMAGAFLALSPLGALTVLAGWEQVFNNLFLIPVVHSSPARHLPLFSAEAYLVRLFFLHVAALAVNLLAGAVAVATTRNRRNYALLSLALFATGITHQAYQRLDSIHLLFAVFVSIGILPLAVLVLLSRWTRMQADAKLAAGAGIGVALLVGIVAWPLVRGVYRSFEYALQTGPGGVMFVEKDGRSFSTGNANGTRTIGGMLDKLERLSKPGERLFVGPADLRRTNYSDTFIYHLMPKLQPATYFLEMNPFSANRPNSRLADDIKSADWLVLNRTWDQWDEPNRSQEYGSEAPNRAVRDHFELVGEYGPFGLFQRKR